MTNIAIPIKYNKIIKQFIESYMLFFYSTCYTRAAPATNQSTSNDEYPDNYDDDYYDENEGDGGVDKATPDNRLTTTTTSKPLFPFFTFLGK